MLTECLHEISSATTGYSTTNINNNTRKMADDTEDGVEGAFKCLVSITERSGNLHKDLKKEILEAMSSLRHYFV